MHYEDYIEVAVVLGESHSVVPLKCRGNMMLSRDDSFVIVG